jgi:lipoprotein signal peptidase
MMWFETLVGFYEELRQLLRIGIQWNTQVTIDECKHTVTQAYCSALPVAYSPHSATLWTEFARLILEASYEATICTAILNSISNGNNRVFLTLLGGGAFGNEIDWIVGAIQRALNLYKHFDLDVAIVSYGSSARYVQQFIERWNYYC